MNQSDLFAPQQGPANSGIPTSIDGLQQSVDTLTVALTLSTTEAIPPHHR